MTVAFRSQQATVAGPPYTGPAIGTSAPAVAPAPAFAQTDLVALSRYFCLLMMRNITSDGYVIEDPVSTGVFSLPGCIIAAPSYPANTPGIDQDYVFNWVRDGAITAIEIALAGLPQVPGGGVPSLIDYVSFAALCQANAKNSATVTLGHACFTITGEVRPWSEQNDGPAIQSIAILTFFDQLDAATQTIAKQLVETNLVYLLEVYQNRTTNLWEEYEGYSFFARAVQLRFFREISGNALGGCGACRGDRCHLVAGKPAGHPLEWATLCEHSGWSGASRLRREHRYSLFGLLWRDRADRYQASGNGGHPATPVGRSFVCQLLPNQWRRRGQRARTALRALSERPL